MTVARQVVAVGEDATAVARTLVEQLSAPGLKLALVFADRRLDPEVIARVTHAALAPAPVLTGTAVGVIARGAPTAHDPGSTPAAVALGLYGDWVRVGIGVAKELSRSPLTRSRDAVNDARTMLGLAEDQLDPARHVGVTIVDGACGHEEAFCIGSAAAAPRARFVGGAASVDDNVTVGARPVIGVGGRVFRDAGSVVLLESDLPFETLRSVHLKPTALKTVVTACAGRIIYELDGQPAVPRLRALLEPMGAKLSPDRPTSVAFARYIDGVPYARSMALLDGDEIHLAASVDVGHVLHVMEPGDLIGTTRADLASAAERVGGEVSALLAFSCISRHWEAAIRHTEKVLAETYAAYPVVGIQSAGEQSGMLLVNHTLTGLIIGATPLK